MLMHNLLKSLVFSFVVSINIVSTIHVNLPMTKCIRTNDEPISPFIIRNNNVSLNELIAKEALKRVEQKRRKEPFFERFGL